MRLRRLSMSRGSLPLSIPTTPRHPSNNRIDLLFRETFRVHRPPAPTRLERRQQTQSTNSQHSQNPSGTVRTIPISHTLHFRRNTTHHHIYHIFCGPKAPIPHIIHHFLQPRYLHLALLTTKIVAWLI